MKKFFLTLSFLNILWAQFSDPAQFTVNIDDVNQGEVAIIDVNAELDFTWRIYAVYDCLKAHPQQNLLSNQILLISLEESLSQSQ